MGIFGFIFFIFQSLVQSPIQELTVYQSQKNDKETFNQVWDITHNDRNEIILGSTDKTQKFNGRNFDNIVGLPSRSLDRDSDGRVYYGSQANFGYLERGPDGKETFVSLVSMVDSVDRAFGDVFDTHVIGDLVYFRTSISLFVYDGKTVQTLIRGKRLHRTYPFGDSLFVTVRGEGPVWVSGNEILHIKNASKFANDLFYVGLDFGDKLILGSRMSGFHVISDDEIQPIPFASSDFLSESAMYNATNLPDSTIAFATNNGVLITDYQGNRVGIIDETNGFVENNVYSVYYLAPNSLWIGMSGSFARMEYPQALHRYNLNDGFSVSGYSSMVEFDNELYVATSGGIVKHSDPSDAKINMFNRGVFSRKGIDLPEEQFLEVEVIDDKLFAGSINGVYAGDGRRFTKISDNYTREITKVNGSDSEVWLGTNQGLFRLNYKSGAIKHFASIPSNEEILNITHESDSVLWIGTLHGNMYRLNLKNEKMDSWSVTDLSTDPRSYPIAITIIDGIVRAHTMGVMHRFDNASFKFVPDSTFYKKYNLDMEPIYRLYKESDLITYDYHSKIQISEAVTGALFHKYPISSINLATAVVSRPSYVWTMSSSSVIKFIYPPKENEVTYQLFENGYPMAISRSDTKQDTLFVFAGSELPFEYNNIKFSFDVASYYIRDEITFSYRLQGFDNWSSWSKTNTIEYSYLPSGNYELQIRARGNYGAAQDLIIPFSVSPVWYLKTSSLAFFGFVFVGFLYGAGVLISKKTTAREKEIYLQRIKEEETQRRESELDEARKFQLSLLPKELPKLDYLRASVAMKTATEVGGDYYDFFYQQKDCVTAVLGDASGHGTTAGMMVQITKAGLIAHLKPNTVPDLHPVNDIFLKLGQRRVKMSLTMAEISRDSVKITMAGMPPIFWYNSKDNTCKEILNSTVPMGTRLFRPNKPMEIMWGENDILVIYSDGLPEITNTQDEDLGFDKIRELIMRNAHFDADKLAQSLVELGEDFAEGKEANDDITIMVLKKV